MVWLKYKFSLFHLSILLHSSSGSTSFALQVLAFTLVLLGIRITASALVLVAVCPKLNDLTANKHNIQHLAPKSHYRSVILWLDSNKTTRCDFSCLSGADAILNGWINGENTHSIRLVSLCKAVWGGLWWNLIKSCAHIWPFQCKWVERQPRKEGRGAAG